MPCDDDELLVQVSEELVGRRRPARRGEQPLGNVRRSGLAAHLPSSCDSTPFHRASNAARELRKADSPDALIV